MSGSHKHFEVSVSFSSLSAAFGRCQAQTAPDTPSRRWPRPGPVPRPGPSPGSFSAAATTAGATLTALLQWSRGARRGGGTRGQGQAAGGAIPPCPADPREPLPFRPVPSEGVLEP